MHALNLLYNNISQHYYALIYIIVGCLIIIQVGHLAIYNLLSVIMHACKVTLYTISACKDRDLSLLIHTYIQQHALQMVKQLSLAWCKECMFIVIHLETACHVYVHAINLKVYAHLFCSHMQLPIAIIKPRPVDRRHANDVTYLNPNVTGSICSQGIIYVQLVNDVTYLKPNITGSICRA